MPSSAPAEARDGSAIRIDAVVTDRQGRPVVGLSPSDFEVLENGVRRPLASAEPRGVPPAVRPAGSAGSAPAAPSSAKESGARIFALFLDEFHTLPGESTDRVRDALARFVDDELQPQDLAVVMKPLDSVATLQFTRDRVALRAAIASFAGRKGDVTPRSAFEAQFIGRAPAAVAAARAQIVTAALRDLTLRLGELQADRVVVLIVSDGFSGAGAAPRGTRAPDLQGIARAASRFHLTIYTFSLDGPAPGPGVGPAAQAESGALPWLASQTGGRAVGGADDLRAALARLAADVRAYYALTFQPSQRDGRFHAVEIRARRGLTVHARPGYWSPPPASRRTFEPAPKVMRGLRRSAMVETWVGVSADPNGRTRLVLTWEPRATASARPAAIVVRARAAGGAELFTGRLAAVRSPSEADDDSARFDVQPGRVEIDIDIVNALGKVLDTETRDLDVPDLRTRRSGPLLFLPQVLRARTLRDFETAAANPEAAPSPGRVFARGDRLLIRVPAFDSSGSGVEVSAMVLNAWAQPMRAIESMPAAEAGVAQFGLPLSWLGPGEYFIEAIGTNANGVVKERVAFRLVG